MIIKTTKKSKIPFLPHPDFISGTFQDTSGMIFSSNSNQNYLLDNFLEEIPREVMYTYIRILKYQTTVFATFLACRLRYFTVFDNLKHWNRPNSVKWQFIEVYKSRSIRTQMLFKIYVLKGATFKAWNFIQKKLQHWRFPVNIDKFLRTVFFYKTPQWLLLNIYGNRSKFFLILNQYWPFFLKMQNYKCGATDENNKVVGKYLRKVKNKDNRTCLLGLTPNFANNINYNWVYSIFSKKIIIMELFNWANI